MNEQLGDAWKRLSDLEAKCATLEKDKADGCFIMGKIKEVMDIVKRLEEIYLSHEYHMFIYNQVKDSLSPENKDTPKCEHGVPNNIPCWACCKNQASPVKDMPKECPCGDKYCDEPSPAPEKTLEERFDDAVKSMGPYGAREKFIIVHIRHELFGEKE